MEQLLLPPEPRAPSELWLYEEVLKRDIPDLTDAAGLAALDELCKVLETAIRLSRSRPAEEDSQDYSYIWRPAIEEHP